MSVSDRPAYIPLISDQSITPFVWDDWRASEDFQFDPSSFLEKAMAVSVRSRIVLCIALFEWVLWWLRHPINDPVPFQVVEACWCGAFDQRYMRFYEFDRREWLGPVRGPLWCGMTWLIPAVVLSDADPEELESGLEYLRRLAHHVTSGDRRLDEWLEPTLIRLHHFFPVEPEDPFDNLFGDQGETVRGPLVPREALDPNFRWDHVETDDLVDQFLRGVDYSQNPFLLSPGELAEEGFTGTPYRLKP